MTFAAFLVRRRGLWYACTMRHVNGDPTEVSFLWTRDLGEAIAFLSANLEFAPWNC